MTRFSDYVKVFGMVLVVTLIWWLAFDTWPLGEPVTGQTLQEPETQVPIETLGVQSPTISILERWTPCAERDPFENDCGDLTWAEPDDYWIGIGKEGEISDPVYLSLGELKAILRKGLDCVRWNRC